MNGIYYIQKAYVNAADTSRLRYWGDEIQSHPPTVTYDEVMQSESGVGRLTSQIVRRTSV